MSAAVCFKCSFICVYIFMYISPIDEDCQLTGLRSTLICSKHTGGKKSLVLLVIESPKIWLKKVKVSHFVKFFYLTDNKVGLQLQLFSLSI